MQKFPNLPNSVLEAEFPEIYQAKIQYEESLKSGNDKESIFIDQDNDNLYLHKDDSKKATKYNLINANRSLKRPILVDSAHISDDQLIKNWGKLDDDNIFDTTNRNWDEIRDYLGAVTRKINNLIDFVTELEPYLDLLAADKDIDLSQILVGVSDEYVKKVETNKKIDYLQREIDNINKAIDYKPVPNGVFPPGFTGEKDININDNISDSDVSNKVESLNDEKGD